MCELKQLHVCLRKVQNATTYLFGLFYKQLRPIYSDIRAKIRHYLKLHYIHPYLFVHIYYVFHTLTYKSSVNGFLFAT